MEKQNLSFKILDCTLRDGGYYTNWDFSTNIVESYIDAMNKLPIDYIEIGYRNSPTEEYLGEFGYTPVSTIRNVRKKCAKKIVVMLNEKNTHTENLEALLRPIQGLADMIRIAIDPKNFDRALNLAKNVKVFGFEVGFNTMYMSKWNEYSGFLDKLSQLDGVVDLFCMVDSFGGVTPNDVKNTIRIVKEKTTVPVGFHGHNNLQLGLINTLTAIENGAEFADVTVLGMGRGAGNLNMELLLSYLNKNGMVVDFNILGDVISAFHPLLEKYNWGTNLPYMISGANSLPQKEVMDWVNNRAYSFNSIVRALDNKKNNIKDNACYPQFKSQDTEKVLIIGGGISCIEHLHAIKQYALLNPEMPIIFVTARYAAQYNSLPNPKYYCLVGNEAKRLSQNISESDFNGICILPPYPRVMGTEVPSYAERLTFELEAITFTQSYCDSCTTLALQTALAMRVKEIHIVGYDGYKGEVLSEKEMELSNENKVIFEDINKVQGVKVKSLTPTLYKSLKIKSIYQLI